MIDKFRMGQSVTWHWGSGTATGVIKERYERQVTRKIKGAEITRNGNHDNPAYLVEQPDGNEVLKLASELAAAG